MVSDSSGGQRTVKRIFTKSFFEQSVADQGRIVEAALRELENQLYSSKADEEKAREAAKRIRRKAVKYGLFTEGGK